MSMRRVAFSTFRLFLVGSEGVRARGSQVGRDVCSAATRRRYLRSRRRATRILLLKDKNIVNDNIFIPHYNTIAIHSYRTHILYSSKY